VDYLYANFYKEQYAAEQIEDSEKIMFDCQKNFPPKSPFDADKPPS
jgi:hypothetical protein